MLKDPFLIFSKHFKMFSNCIIFLSKYFIFLSFIIKLRTPILSATPYKMPFCPGVLCNIMIFLTPLSTISLKRQVFYYMIVVKCIKLKFNPPFSLSS